MSRANTKLSDIESKLSMLSPEQIYALIKGVSMNNRVHKIDYSHRLRRIETNELYFSAEPKPHQLINDKPMSPEEYRGHRQGVWEQIMSGVDL